MPAQVIKISGARQHNLKNLHLEIPREKLVVITGLSGSGKSSLAFDTLYAEGQRRYVESLSAYARQFLDRMEKPDVDFIEGLSPAIAIEQDRSERSRLKKNQPHTIEAVVDRLVVRDGIRVRLTDSIETALKWGGNRVVVLCQRRDSASPTGEWQELRYSTDYGNAETGFTVGELTPKHFSFNSHLGACPACHGLGTQLVVDPELMIPDTSKTLAEGVIRPWRRGTKRMQAYYRHLQSALVKHFRVDEDVPFADLSDEFKKALYLGTNGQPIKMSFGDNEEKNAGKPFDG